MNIYWPQLDIMWSACTEIPTVTAVLACGRRPRTCQLNLNLCAAIIVQWQSVHRKVQTKPMIMLLPVYIVSCSVVPTLDKYYFYVSHRCDTYFQEFFSNIFGQARGLHSSNYENLRCSISDVQIVVQPGSLAARNYLSWQKLLADLSLFRSASSSRNRSSKKK